MAVSTVAPVAAAVGLDRHLPMLSWMDLGNRANGMPNRTVAQIRPLNQSQMA